ICETGLVPKSLPWHPREVLELTRWSAGEDTEHLDRALSCVLLCLAPSDSDLLTNGAILAESCLALGPHPAQLAEEFFAWYSETEEFDDYQDDEDDEDDEDQDEYEGYEKVTSLFLLFLLRATIAPDDPRLDALARMLTEDRFHSLTEIAREM